MAGKHILLGLLLLLLLAAAVGGGVFAYRSLRPPGSPRGEAPSPKVAIGPIYRLDPFTVNLADTGRSRFLRVVLQLELDAPPAAAELDSIEPRVRDATLTLLSSKRSGELATVGDKERLRNEIIHRLNGLLSAGKVIEVYFTEFVVQ